MVFVSNSFVFLFLPCFLLVYSVVPGALRNTTILFFSWLFYAWWRLDFLPLIVGIAVWSWITAFWIERAMARERRWALFVGVAGPLAALVWFKYANLLVDTLGWFVAPVSGWEAIILPIGLSFFVFGAVSYSVDIYRATVPAERSFINYATYQSMFGHLVAGPVVRYRWVAERLKVRSFERDEFMAGVQRFMLGFAQKVLLADTLAPVVDAGYSLSAPTMLDAMVTVTAYTMQLYFDFAGYSSMAIGLGLMVGLKFPENFDRPYLSTSLAEFWRRWHISLSSWLRDYLYIPLGGNREGVARTCINLLITMGLGGLWHGASWTFLVWGLWHGAGLVIARLWGLAFRTTLPYVVGHVLTLGFVMVGWALFRAENWTSVAVISKGLAGANGIGPSGAFLAALRPVEVLSMLAGALLIYAPLLERRWKLAGAVEAYAQAWSALPLWLTALWVLQGRIVVPFLYFQF
jgi:alginate O-acetyltransferase complex protein AlgI